MNFISRFKILRSERGTMIPMYVVFVMVIVGLLTIVLDSTQVYLQRRTMQGVADGASLAAADGIDVSNLYDEGLDDQGRVELVHAQASSAVADYVAMVNRSIPSARRKVDCSVGPVEVNRVRVACTGTAILPIVNYVSQAAGFDATVKVDTESWADANIAG